MKPINFPLGHIIPKWCKSGGYCSSGTICHNFGWLRWLAFNYDPTQNHSGEVWLLNGYSMAIVDYGVYIWLI